MLKRLAPLLLIAALAAPASASAEVTIKLGGDQAKYRETLYPGTFRLKGKTGDYRGPVQLHVDEFPYDNSTAVATSTTNEKGEYVFPKVRLSRNARVAVSAGPELSKRIELFVHPGVKYKERLVADYRVKVTFTYLGHPGFAPPADSFFVYLSRSDKSKQIFRLGSARRMVNVGDGKWRYSGIVKLPSDRNYRYALLYCTRGLSAGGYGRAYRVDRHCGEKNVPFPNANKR